MTALALAATLTNQMAADLCDAYRVESLLNDNESQDLSYDADFQAFSDRCQQLLSKAYNSLVADDAGSLEACWNELSRTEYLDGCPEALSLFVEGMVA